MPIHDWTRREAGDSRDFHQSWTVGIRNALHKGLLPEYLAMVEQVTGRPIADVVTLPARRPALANGAGGVAVTEAPPAKRFLSRSQGVVYARRKNRVVIRQGRGKVVSRVEIVSPGN